MKSDLLTNQFADLAKYLLLVIAVVCLTFVTIFYSPSNDFAGSIAEDSKNFFEHSLFENNNQSIKVWDYFLKSIKA